PRPPHPRPTPATACARSPPARCCAQSANAAFRRAGSEGKMGMRKAVAAMVLAGWGSAAAAADKIAFGPAPAWVKPVALPAPDGKDKEAAVRLLLQDQQARLGPGGSTIYAETAYRIQTPQ